MWALALLMEMGPHKDREKLWPGWELNPRPSGQISAALPTELHDLRVRSPPLYRLSYKVRREQAVGIEDVKVTAMNMYKYKERLRLLRDWNLLFITGLRDWNLALHITLYSVNSV